MGHHLHIRASASYSQATRRARSRFAHRNLIKCVPRIIIEPLKGIMNINETGSLFAPVCPSGRGDYCMASQCARHTMGGLGVGVAQRHTVRFGVLFWALVRAWNPDGILSRREWTNIDDMVVKPEKEVNMGVVVCAATMNNLVAHFDVCFARVRQRNAGTHFKQSQRRTPANVWCISGNCTVYVVLLYIYIYTLYMVTSSMQMRTGGLFMSRLAWHFVSECCFRIVVVIHGVCVYVGGKVHICRECIP